MIIINDKPGQLCNRLWAYSFFVAYALKHRVNIYIPNFREYRSYFENLSAIPNVHFAIVAKPVNIDNLTYQSSRLITWLLRIISSAFSLKFLGIYLDPEHWTYESWDFSLLDKKGSIIFLGSWFHPKDVPALLEYKNAVLKLFEPKSIHKEKVDSLFRSLRLQFRIIIGIHIRRRDYANFHGGAYLFDDTVYKRYMKAIQDWYGTRSICFFLSSDEKIDSAKFNEYELAHLEAPAMIEDLYALSKCDYILGPPGTFSMWASFIGDVPLRIVKLSNENISLDQFSPILYQNVFKNGERFHHIDDNASTVLHEKSLLG